VEQHGAVRVILSRLRREDLAQHAGFLPHNLQPD
jgi:hypothetical protein